MTSSPAAQRTGVTPMRPVARVGYRDLPRLAGRSYLPISWPARLPAAMTPIALLAFVATGTGSFATAGLAVTASALGTAAGAPLSGMLVDRLGQRVVLVPAALLNAAVLLTLASARHAPAALLVLLGAVAGLTAPQVGAMSRARWIALTSARVEPGRRAEVTRTFMSWEGFADEVAFVAGPALAGVVAALAGPAAALGMAGAVGAVAGLAFAVHPTGRLARPGAHLPSGPFDGPKVGALLASLAVPLLAMGMLGVLFAATQTAVTAFAEGAGRPAAGGLLYSGMAVTSAITAVLMPRVPTRFGHRVRCLVAGIGLLVGVLAMATAAQAGSLPLLAAAVLLAGVFVSPMLITVHSMVAELAPAGRVATAMALLASAGVTGVALGAAGSGVLADRWGTTGAFGVAAVAMTVHLVVQAFTRRDGGTTGAGA